MLKQLNELKNNLVEVWLQNGQMITVIPQKWSENDETEELDYLVQVVFDESGKYPRGIGLLLSNKSITKLRLAQTKAA